jgi:hypothetical protein
MIGFSARANFCVPLFFFAIVSGKDSAGNIAGSIKFYGIAIADGRSEGDCGILTRLDVLRRKADSGLRRSPQGASIPNHRSQHD